MKKSYRRTPRGYDGIKSPTHHLREVLPSVLGRIGRSFEDRGDLIIAAWPSIIGARLAAMTEATSFSDGFLVVRVKNSTLHSLLSQVERPRLLKSLRQKFPKTLIKNISFRVY